MRYTTLSKQTRSFFVRIEIKMLVILRMLFAYMSPESIRTHVRPRISILFFAILNSLLRILSHVLYRSHSASYVGLCSFLKMNVTFLRRCCLTWKRKQHKFETFGQIKWITGKQWVLPVKRSKCLLRFKFFKSKQCENKLSSKQRNPSW